MRLKRTVPLMIIIILLFTILTTAMASASTTGGIIDYSHNNFTSHSHYLINVTKTTGGWPLFENDIYTMLGVVVNGASWVGDGWQVSFEVVDLSSSRAPGSADKTYSLRSKTIKVKGSPNNKVWSVGQTYGANYLTKGSWPHGDPFNKSQMPDRLMQATINTTPDSAPFPLSATELCQNLTWGSDYEAHTGPELMKESNEKTKLWIWYFSTWPWENKPDCAVVTLWGSYVPPGETVEFDVVDDTYWGLFDSSNTVVHYKFTVPPDPRNLSRSELKEHGITAWVSDYHFISSGSGNNLNISYAQGEPNIVGYSAGDLNVEMS